MTLSKSKQALADAVHASGKGWPDGANWACQHKRINRVVFTRSTTKPKLCAGKAGWNVEGDCFFEGFTHDKLIPNWHLTIISRDEYFSAYPETVAKSTAVGDDETNLAAKEELEALEYCESVTRSIPDPDVPTTDTLLAAWQSAQAATREARVALEAAEQAEREAEEAVKAALGKYGWGESVVEGDEGWIEWGGGECPVEEGTLIDVRYRDGEEKFGLNALWNEEERDSSESFWRHDDYNVDIVADRLHRP